MTPKQASFPPTAKESAARAFEQQAARDEAARRIDKERTASGFYDKLQAQADSERRDALLRWRASLGREPTTGENLRAVVQVESNEHAQRRARESFLEQVGPTLTLSEALLELDEYGRVHMMRWLLGGAPLFNSIGATSPSESACAGHRHEVTLRILALHCADCGGDPDAHIVSCGGEHGGRPHALRLKVAQISGDASYLANVVRRGGDTTLYRTLLPDGDGCATVPALEAVTFLRGHSHAGVPQKRRYRDKGAKRGDRWLLEEVPPTPKVQS